MGLVEAGSLGMALRGLGLFGVLIGEAVIYGWSILTADSTESDTAAQRSQHYRQNGSMHNNQLACV